MVIYGIFIPVGIILQLKLYLEVEFMSKILEQNAQWLDATWAKVDRKLSKVCIRSREIIPYLSENGVHIDNTVTPWSWVNGFWGGMMWLMYVNTKNEEYKITALRAEELLDEGLKYFKELHHDVGFMWHLTAVANYRITGNPVPANKALFLASSLSARYNIDGQFIQAWNNFSNPWTIIDTLMNLPLLYWADTEVGDTRFGKIARRHADMAIRDHIRPDGSVNHIVMHDPLTGEVLGTRGGQGYCEGSAWTRGCSWAVYGMAISYLHTGEQRYLDAAIHAADYFVEKCRENNYLTKLDFCQPEEDNYYDSTAGVITACGLIEIGKALGGERGEYYIGEAIQILKATDEHFCNYNEDEDPLVMMGSVAYPHKPSLYNKQNIPIIYGDFFYVDALAKLKGSDFLIW